LLTQGKDDNEAGRKKDKQDTVNNIAREYKYGIAKLTTNSLQISH